ncbi:ribbon-helix-helix domain-containing protein [Streptomyces malaysiensis]|uniref:ribbon-helix-helix domain-containing protein n=1 Tax=Streptomyces malaysiensis TaxID=92644 RepID=UPI002B2B4E55|nr:CopG family transcriptional regulator [Streptomyces malaysiensis]
MSLERVTITIPSETLSAAKEAADREGMSVSAWLSRAAERATKIEAGLVAAEEVLTEIGPPTPEEQAWVDEFMDTVTRPVADGGSGVGDHAA